MDLQKTSRPLRILIQCLNFSPDLVGIPKYTSEMVTWLGARGHAVRVVTAPPYYPEWRIGRGYAAGRYRVEWQDAIKVVRCPLWVPRNPTGLKRILHLCSFGLSSLPVIIYEALRFRPDVIWTVQPALLATPGTLLAAKLSGAKSWMHVQDLEIDAAFQLGLLGNPMSRRAALALHRTLLRAFDHVSSISLRMCQTLIDQGARAEHTSLVWNWVDTSYIRPDPQSAAALRVELGIPGEATIALYSGSMGNKQGLSIITDAARLLDGRSQGRPRVEFLLCGEGTYRRELEQLASDLDNVRFLPLQPLDRFNALLGMADIHLLPQRANAADLVLPSKLGGMMASARPIVVTAHADTTLASLVGPCGVVVPPEDTESFAAAIAGLALDPERRQILGARGRAAAESDWSTDEVLGGFERQLQALAGH